jgi:hypothetical protein
MKKLLGPKTYDFIVWEYESQQSVEKNFRKSKEKRIDAVAKFRGKLPKRYKGDMRCKT